jgi:hypothetical protein
MARMLREQGGSEEPDRRFRGPVTTLIRSPTMSHSRLLKLMSAEARGKSPWMEHDVAEKRVMPSTQQALTASQLLPLVNSYTISPGPPKTVVVPNASKLAQLQELSVAGTLLAKQFVTLDPRTNRRTVAADPAGYTISPSDGDLHLDLGTVSLQPSITCELQNAQAWLSLFKSSVGQQVTVSGFFRCLFEHPGFSPGDDAHVFEVHPVRAVSIAGKIQSFDVGIPDQQSIHSWTSPHPLNVQDNRVQVKYNSTSDSLTFTGMDGADENYVRVAGTIGQVQLNNNGGGPASFALSSPEIGHPVLVYSLQGTNATRQLARLTGSKVSMIALRNIDLPTALKGSYSINLLAIDIQARVNAG